MAELADATDLKSVDHSKGHMGSTPIKTTNFLKKKDIKIMNKIMLFLSSLIILWITILLSYIIYNQQFISTIALIMILINPIWLFLVVKPNKAKTVKLENITPINTDVLKYTILSLLPALTLFINKPYDCIAFIFALFLLGNFYIKNNMFYLNPLFILLNWKLYYALYKNNDYIYIITMKHSL